MEKFSNIDSNYLLAPNAVKILGPFNASACQLLISFGGKISQSSGKQLFFLFRRTSMLLQHFNALLLHDSLPAFDCTD